MNESSSQKPFRVWDYKPWWCQPWSIVLTATTLIGGSWVLFQRIWVTGLVSLPVLAWMIFFLFIYPALMQRADSTQEPSEPS